MLPTLPATTTADAAGPVGAADDVASADAVDTVHDLLLQLLDDPSDAAAATEDVVRRTAARVTDGVLEGIDLDVLLTATHAHATGLARAGRTTLPASAVTDLTVLDLVIRRGLPPSTVSTVTGVPERELGERRARAANRLATPGGSSADAERRHARQDVRRAPAGVHRRATDVLAAASPPERTRRPIVRALVVAAAATAALTGLAVWTPWLVSESQPGPQMVEAVETSFTPTARPIADVAGGGQADQDPAAADEDAEDGDVLLPQGSDDTGIEVPLGERLPDSTTP